MHVLIDIGNSTIVVAIADQQGDITSTWRFKTRKEETVTFFRYELKQGLRKYNLEPADIESVVISSVVPEVNDDVAQAINDLTGLTPHFFCIDDAQGLITIDIESPTQLGKDRLADALGAVACYGAPAIVIDFGTATTFGAMSEKGEFVGGAIAPGLKLMADALVDRAAKLPRFELVRPDRVIGRNTVTNLQSGLIYGAVGQVIYLVGRMREELGSPNAKVIATGGLALLISAETDIINVLDGLLTLKGLRIIYERNM